MKLRDKSAPRLYEQRYPQRYEQRLQELRWERKSEARQAERLCAVLAEKKVRSAKSKRAAQAA
jgi:hypothetical protein